MDDEDNSVLFVQTLGIIYYTYNKLYKFHQFIKKGIMSIYINVFKTTCFINLHIMCDVWVIIICENSNNINNYYFDLLLVIIIWNPTLELCPFHDDTMVFK